MKRLFLVCALGIIGILGACSLSLRPTQSWQGLLRLSPIRKI